MRIRLWLLVLGALLLVPTPPSAQTDMARHFYLVPKIGDGLSIFTAFRPKYIDVDALGAGWNISARSAGKEYRTEAVYLLRADLTAAENTQLSAQPDVFAFPIPLTDPISALALPGLQATLEGLHIPNQYITTSLTYVQVIRGIGKLAVFSDRYSGLFPDTKIFESGVTLATQINQLTQAQRQRLIDTSDSFGLDRSGITNTMTLWQALRLIADQLPSPIFGDQPL